MVKIEKANKYFYCNSCANEIDNYAIHCGIGERKIYPYHYVKIVWRH